MGVVKIDPDFILDVLGLLYSALILNNLPQRMSMGCFFCLREPKIKPLSYEYKAQILFI